MKTAERIKLRKEQRLYRKDGKKYVAFNDPYATNGLRNGWWLVNVEDGCTSIREAVFPHDPEIEAAARVMEDKLVRVIMDIGKARPRKIVLTKSERDDWEHLIKKHGESFNMLCYPSAQEAARLIVKALKEGVR